MKYIINDSRHALVNDAFVHTEYIHRSRCIHLQESRSTYCCICFCCRTKNNYFRCCVDVYMQVNSSIYLILRSICYVLNITDRMNTTQQQYRRIVQTARTTASQQQCCCFVSCMHPVYSRATERERKAEQNPTQSTGGHLTSRWGAHITTARGREQRVCSCWCSCS